MNDFDWDALQKKRVAQGAMHKKNGSKSKKCTMPSDYLSKKERDALNGPVTEVCLNRPMDWRSFKKLSDTLKVEYIKYLQETHDANTMMLAEMFGCTNVTVLSAMKRLGMSTKRKDHITRWLAYETKMAAWRDFCRGEDNETPEEEKADTEALEAEEDVSKLADAVLAAIHPPVADHVELKGNVRHLDMTFAGFPDEMTMTILRNMFHDQTVKVRISAEVIA